MSEQPETARWYVMRDLKRANAKSPAYKVLPELGFETFTPMQWVIIEKSHGHKERRHVPFIPTLLFVRSLKSDLDAVVDKIDTLQYQYIRGVRQTPMVVPAEEMDRFIKAVSISNDCIYYRPEDITAEMLGKKVMIVGGALDGAVGHLIARRGTKSKRLLLHLKDMLIASVEIESEYIKFV